MASREETRTLRVTHPRRRSGKSRDATAHRAVGRKPRQAPKAKCPNESDRLPVRRRLHGSKSKPRRTNTRRGKSQETPADMMKPSGKAAGKKRRQASVPLIQLPSGLEPRRECDSEGAIATDSSGAEGPGGRRRTTRRGSSNRLMPLRSIQSDKWQQAMLRKHQSSIRRRGPASGPPKTRSGSATGAAAEAATGAAPTRGTNPPSKPPGYRDIVAVIKTFSKGNASSTRRTDSAPKVRVVNSGASVRDKGKTRSYKSDITVPGTDHSDRVHGNDHADHRAQRASRKTRPRVATSEPQVPKARRTKAVSAPTKLKVVRRKSTKKIRSMTEGENSSKTITIPKGSPGPRVVRV